MKITRLAVIRSHLSKGDVVIIIMKIIIVNKEQYTVFEMERKYVLQIERSMWVIEEDASVIVTIVIISYTVCSKAYIETKSMSLGDAETTSVYASDNIQTRAVRNKKRKNTVTLRLGKDDVGASSGDRFNFFFSPSCELVASRWLESYIN